MTHRRRATKCVVLFLAATVGPPATGLSALKAQTGIEKQNKLLETTVPRFEVHKVTLLDALWELARGPVPFGFGFEKQLKTSLMDAEIRDPLLTLQLEGKSIREILNALCDADSRYTWSIDGMTIDVFPRTVIADASYLLNRKLENFELKNATDVQDGLLAIARQLPPPVEQIAQAQIGGDDSYPPEPWAVALENVTVRQVVNRLAEHCGPCAVWIFGGARDFRAFGFFKTFTCTEHQPPPWAQKIIDSREKPSKP